MSDAQTMVQIVTLHFRRLFRSICQHIHQVFRFNRYTCMVHGKAPVETGAGFCAVISLRENFCSVRSSFNLGDSCHLTYCYRIRITTPSLEMILPVYAVAFAIHI